MVVVIEVAKMLIGRDKKLNGHGEGNCKDTMYKLWQCYDMDRLMVEAYYYLQGIS